MGLTSKSKGWFESMFASWTSSNKKQKPQAPKRNSDSPLLIRRGEASNYSVSKQQRKPRASTDNTPHSCSNSSRLRHSVGSLGAPRMVREKERHSTTIERSRCENCLCIYLIDLNHGCRQFCSLDCKAAMGMRHLRDSQTLGFHC